MLHMCKTRVCTHVQHRLSSVCSSRVLSYPCGIRSQCSALSGLKRLSSVCRQLGYTNVTELDHGQTLTVADGKLSLTGTEGAHASIRILGVKCW